ncbi:g6640 [Coccomyxa elongata]
MTPVKDDNLISALKLGDPQYGTRTEGVLGTLGFRTFLQACHICQSHTVLHSCRLKTKEQGADVSPWHDVDLRNDDGTLNFVCEIPKDTSAKFEVATGERSNPIKQDVKKGAPRFYPYSIPWNYGMLPQTWEDPQAAHAGLPGVGGDNDPVDVVEIGGDALATAGVYSVKVLGAYAMIDCGELDWKIICIRTDHPLAPKLIDITDMERELPGELEKIMVWFRDYKIPDGKPANAFGFEGKPVSEGYAKAVVEETHQAYSQLRSGARANDGNLSLQ